LPRKLTTESLLESTAALAERDTDLAAVVSSYGPPPLWAREPGFATLIRIILEQQVSLASADAMYRRLLENVGPLTPDTILATGESRLRSFGVTRQKTRYFINVASAIETGQLDLDDLVHDSDEVVSQKLTSVTGIGPWTARIYLLMALCRPDVWPVGDIALATAFKNLKGWQQRPRQTELKEFAKIWCPHRATAARLLWHYYLCKKADGRQVV